jgi:hypothetical protein
MGIRGYESVDEIPFINEKTLMDIPVKTSTVKPGEFVPTSLKEVQEKIVRYSASRQKDAERLLDFVELTDKKLITSSEWDAVEAESKRIWDIAGEYDQLDEIEVEGIRPHAVERMARFYSGNAGNRHMIEAAKGKLDNDYIKQTIGGENPVGRASLQASEKVLGESVAPQVRRWSKELGKVIWEKSTTEQRVMFLKSLGADELESIGITFKAPTTAQIPVGISKGEVVVTPLREQLQRQAADVNAITFYHGTKAEIEDLTVLNPKNGSSFGELGSGIYLTSSPSDAEHYAKAFIPENKYPTGDVRTSAVGKVHEVKVKIAAPLDGNQPVPPSIGKKFNRYLKEVHPDIDYKTGSKSKVATILLKVRESAQATAGDVPVSEARMVEIQRVFTDIVQSEGYDSIVKMNRDGTLTASVFNGENLKVSRQTPVGDGSIAEGHFSRKYLDEYMHSQYPNYTYTRANMLKSRIEAEEFMFKETEKAWKEAAQEAEAKAATLAATQNELESLNRTATRQAADNIVATTEDAPKKELKKFMEDTDNLCL